MDADFRELAREEIRDLPVYCPGLDADGVKRLYGVDRVIKLASNENPLGPSPMAVEAVRNAAEQVNLYPDGSCALLRNKLSERLGVGGECLFFGNGTDEIIDLLFLAFFDTGDSAVMGDPTFSSYFLSGMCVGAGITYVQLRDFGHHPEDILNAVDERTKAVFVGTPHNPTGAICSSDEFERITRGIPPGVLLVWDEAYCEYVDDPDFPDSVARIEEFGNLVVLRTFSKIFGLAGLRVGYGVASPGVVDMLERVRPPFNVNRLAQAAAVAALDDGEHLERSKRINAEGKKFLGEELVRLGLSPVPTQANFILFRYDHLVDRLSRKLLERGIIVRDGEALGYPGYVRMTIGTPEANREVISVLEQIINKGG
jgi:histidinol-phosphate aminotransferase